MGLMYIGLEEGWYNCKCLCVFYEVCVKGGIGLIIIGGYSLNLWGKLLFFVLMFNLFYDVIKYCVYMDVVY